MYDHINSDFNMYDAQVDLFSYFFKIENTCTSVLLHDMTIFNLVVSIETRHHFLAFSVIQDFINKIG